MYLNSIKKHVVFMFALLCISCGVQSSEEYSQYDTILINGELRKYRLFVPPSYTSDINYPLVLNFHGTSNNPEMQEGLSKFEVLANHELFIVVTPLASYTRTTDGPITWNVNKKAGPDDVRFISELLVKLKNSLAIDDKRIYATGFSGGARMSSRLACDLSTVIAAIGPVAGVRFPPDCKPSRAMPVITFHGEQDTINHFKVRDDSPVYWTMGVEDALAGWINNNQCEAPIQTTLSASLTRFDYQQCDNHSEVVFYRSSDAGHTWPGSPIAQQLEQYGLGKTEEKLDATQLIWTFFKTHSLP